MKGIKNTKNRNPGRPSSYSPKVARQAYEAAKCGANDKEIASILGIDQRTLSRWKKNFEELCLSICNGKNDYLFSTKRSLYRRAIGYRYQEVTRQKIEVDQIKADGDIERVPATLTKIVSKHMPGDVGACERILKNSKAKEW